MRQQTLVKQKDRAGVEEFARKNGTTVEGEYARRVLRDEVSDSSIHISFCIVICVRPFAALCVMSNNYIGQL